MPSGAGLPAPPKNPLVLFFFFIFFFFIQGAHTYAQPGRSSGHKTGCGWQVRNSFKNETRSQSARAYYSFLFENVLVATPPTIFLFLFLLFLFFLATTAAFWIERPAQENKRKTKNYEKLCYFLGCGDAWGTLIIAIVCVCVCVSSLEKRRGGRLESCLDFPSSPLCVNLNVGLGFFVRFFYFFPLP